MITDPPLCNPYHRLSFGGSLIRPEATGYGLIYFLEEMIKGNNDELKVRAAAAAGATAVRLLPCALQVHDLTMSRVRITGGHSTAAVDLTQTSAFL